MLCCIKHEEIQYECGYCEKNCAACIDNDSRTDDFLTNQNFGNLTPVNCVKDHKIVFMKPEEINNILVIAKPDAILKYFSKNQETIKSDIKKYLSSQRKYNTLLSDKKNSENANNAYKALISRIDCNLSDLRKKLIRCSQR